MRPDELFAAAAPHSAGYSATLPLHVGNARDGLRQHPASMPNIAGHHRELAHALGALFIGDVGIDLHPGRWGDTPDVLVRLDGDHLTPVMQATVWRSAPLAGTPDILWVVNGVEMLAFDGKRWKQTPRIGYEPCAPSSAPRPPKERSAPTPAKRKRSD